jgi:stage II sporulation protein GA (sporulation sigma-E factor processing peptidase)
VRAAASSGGWKRFIADWAVFFVVSFLFAGVMLAIWMFLRPAGMLYSNGIVYFDISPFTLLISMAAAYLLTGFFWRFVREGRITAERYRMRLRRGELSVTIDAFVDSGNRLYEPFDNSPVIVCALDALRPLLGQEEYTALGRGDYEKTSELGIKLRFVPYKVIRGAGILPSFRVDEITLENAGGRFAVEDAYIAVSSGHMPHKALLHPDLAKVGATLCGRPQ